MIYPKGFEQKIGFDSIRKYLTKRCISDLGKVEVSEMNFSSDYNFVLSRLRETNEYLYILNKQIEFPLNSFSDITLSINNIRLDGTYLTAQELFSLSKSIKTMGEITSFFNKDKTDENRYPTLSLLSEQLNAFPEISREINRVIDKFGEVKDNASEHLFELKKSLISTTSSINGILRRIMSSAREDGLLEKDAAPSIRDGRLVIPVSPMYKRRIKGIVHDESATGKTVFIEPAEIVEANNNIRELESEIKREIIKILISVSAIIIPHVDELLSAYKILGKFDFIQAKAKFAKDLNATLPKISDTRGLEWYNAIHPVLYTTLQKQNKSVVPLNIQLDKNNRVLLISGPNAGGKSICLKTVAINQYMLQCGVLPVMYSNSHVGIFENIFVDIGDEQSIEDDLSTYSSHLFNMKYFLNKGNDKTLILIDEFGGGTEPQIGGAIAQSILEYLNNNRVFGVITTHYQNLKHFAEETEGILNGAMLYDRQNMRPLFSLSIGYPGSSFAVEIARKIGLPAEIISKAQEIVGSDYINLDKYILDINRDRKYWEHKRQQIRIKDKKLSELVDRYDEEIENLSSERKEILRQAKKEAKQILSSSNSAIENTIKDIKLANAEKEKTKEVRRQLDEFKQKILSEDDIEKNDLRKIKHKTLNYKKNKNKVSNEIVFEIGDNVTMEGSKTIGEIISISGNTAMVAFGFIKSKVELSKLNKSTKTTEQKQIVNINISSNSSRDRQLNFSPDIDVRGMKVDEALQAITYFLDDAVQFSIQRLRILHGTGNGILRENIRKYLNSYPEVKSYKDEHVQFGGAGITVIELR